MQDLKVTLVQSDLVWEDPEKNLENLEKKIDSVSEKADLIILPEMFNTGFTMNVENCAEDKNGETFRWMKRIAGLKNCIITGSILTEENNKYYNRLYWVGPEGTFKYYNKRHLFRMGQEHLTISQGLEKCIVNLNGWNINLQICYDLRFPVWSKNSWKNNKYEYDVLIYVANWPEIRNGAYKSLLIARAIENQSYVIWVNRTGVDGNHVSFSGDTMIVDPYGKIVNKAEAGTEICLSDNLSRKLLDDFRNKFTIGLDWDQFRIIQ